ncbi:hypothetical protein EYF80_034372 [Liparis tanakae]|uniref:Uncharacterized protein n=1 Tax=Liparis tanakae TaxID=230148 RepID=A0A4Z2GRS8_9TELE|nr:hypothetical protein EYF80_034372 [Liparis tanakae]
MAIKLKHLSLEDKTLIVLKNPPPQKLKGEYYEPIDEHDEVEDTTHMEHNRKVLRGGFSRDAFLCFEPAVDFHSHPVEAAGTLVDDAVAAVGAVVARGRRGAAQAGVVADGILELVDLGRLGLQFHAEMLYLELLGAKLQVPMCQLRLQVVDISTRYLRTSVCRPGGSVWMEARQLFSSACGAFIDPLPMARHRLATIGMALSLTAMAV